MAENVAETLIGAAVLAAAGGFLVYAVQTTGMGRGASGTYELTAAFRKVEGLSIGADVRVAGVKVGTLRDLELDMTTYRAVARFVIDERVKLPEDSDAAIQTEGLLGGAYVAITPGSSDLMLAPGEAIQYTQGSVNLMDLVGRAISGGGN